MLIARGLRNDERETRERMAVEAFALGYAGEEHFDTIADMQGAMVLAGSTDKKRQWAANYAKNEIGPVLQAIKTRYAKTRKMGCTGEELKRLRGFVSKYRDFWMRQPLELYQAACTALQRHYNQLAAKAKEEAA